MRHAVRVGETRLKRGNFHDQLCERCSHVIVYFIFTRFKAPAAVLSPHPESEQSDFQEMICFDANQHGSWWIGRS